MSLAKITLIGFYNTYENENVIPIFNDLVLPGGIDKELFINSLLLDAGEFEVLYADPDFFRSAVGIWGKKWYRTFEKWYAALQVHYDPLNNYDRTETWTTDRGSTTNASDTTTTSGTTSSTTNKSSYDSSTLTPYESISGTSSGSSNGSSSMYGSENEVRTGRAFGNIGVTTSQQMLQSELELQEWNLYQHMIDLFKTELLIPIY